MNDQPDSSSIRQVQVDEAIAEYFEAIDRHERLNERDWLDRYPDLREELTDFLATERAMGATFLVDPLKLIESESQRDNPLGESRPAAAASENYPEPDRPDIGPYRVIRLLGAGGMGRVYEAIDPSGNRVAVKLLSPRWTRSKETLQRFKQEGQIASAINHPRCVFVKAADDDGGQPYIVMELMTGRTLKDLTQEKGQLPVTDAVRSILDLLEGLEEAHLHGMIHRDIKPANCYLETNGRVKVGDFGLARSIAGDSELTQTGDFVGTPLFASPEQVKGQPIDVRTDIYSVCATLYYLLTGKAPFAGSSPTSVIARIVSEDPQPIRELNPLVPELLERTVLRGLQRDRGLRYQTVPELRQALQPFVAGRQAISDWGRRFAAFGLDSVLVGLIGGIAVLWLVPRDIAPSVSFGLYLTLLLPAFAYYLFFEVWNNASPGKRLLRLQIVDARTVESPSRARLLFRLIIAFVCMGIGTDLLVYAFVSSRDPLIWMGIQYSGYAASYLLILSPLLFRRHGRLLLHDWLSRTLVVNRTLISPQQRLAGQAAEYQLPRIAATGFPQSLGDFQVTGLVCKSDSGAVLTGRHVKLDRNVWLQLRPCESPELSLNRRSCARTTRLRWLTGGRDQTWRWDAYLAYRGAPLKHWTAAESPLDWRATRGILKQLVEEIEHSVLDGDPIEIHSLDQIWMDTRGRVAILDWSPHDGPLSHSKSSIVEKSEPSVDQSVPSRMASNERFVPLRANDRALLRETARLALCGTSRLLVDPPIPVPAIVPLHAQGFLQSLAREPSEATPPMTTNEVLARLEANSQKPSESNLESRAMGLGVSLVTCSVIFTLVASLSRLCNHIILLKLSDQIVATAAAEWLSSQPSDAWQVRIGEKINDFPTPEELRQWLQGRQERDRQARVEFQRRVAAMGFYSRAVAFGTKLVDDPFEQLKRVQFEWKQQDLQANHWTTDESQSPVDLQLLSRVVHVGPDFRPVDLLRRGPFLVVFLTLISPLVWAIWIGLTRGGISMWVSGLSIVGSDGKPAPWWLHQLRPALMVLPILLLQIAIAWIDLFHGEFIWVSALLYQVLIGVFLAYAIFTIAFPRRAPHDWLLGTHLVPK